MKKPTAAAPSPIATIVSPFFRQLRRITIVNGPGRGAIAGSAEAPVKMVVDHADVLHKRVHAGRSHEPVTPATSTAWRTPPPARNGLIYARLCGPVSWFRSAVCGLCGRVARLWVR